MENVTKKVSFISHRYDLW